VTPTWTEVPAGALVRSRVMAALIRFLSRELVYHS